MPNSSITLATDIPACISSIPYTLPTIHKVTCFLFTALLLHAITHKYNTFRWYLHLQCPDSWSFILLKITVYYALEFMFLGLCHAVWWLGTNVSDHAASIFGMVLWNTAIQSSDNMVQQPRKLWILSPMLQKPQILYHPRFHLASGFKNLKLFTEYVIIYMYLYTQMSIYQLL